MQTFLALYMASVEKQADWKHTSPEAQKEGMDEWLAWANSHTDAWVDMGNPTGGNQRIDQSGASPSQNEVCGYSIVQAESIEAAAAMFVNSPHVTQLDAWVDLMPIVNMMPE